MHFKNQTTFRALTVLFVLTGFIMSSCIKDKCSGTVTYVKKEAILMPLEQLRSSFAFEAPRPINKAGKIYRDGNYLFINEPEKGIHIFDNSNPSNPSNLGFLNITGNVDMAVKDNMLYADNVIDLLVIDITNPMNPTLKSRLENTFPKHSLFAEGKLIVGYEDKTITEKYNCNEYDPSLVQRTGLSKEVLFNGNGNDVVAPAPAKGGSLARFAIHNDYLYAVDMTSLYSFSINNPASPSKSNVLEIGTDIETVFPYKDNLFIGSQTGMSIYSITNPSSPSFESVFHHSRSCDPVVVNDHYCYVTLRSGNACRNTFTNQMDILDISSVSNPQMLTTYPMNHPFGLGVDGNNLFLCDGTAGVKVFNIQNGSNLSLLGTYDGFEAYDVIAQNKLLIVITSGGIYQYDYTNPSALRLLSHITTGAI